MKILSLRFQNLNSLKDEWFIDFESSEFTEESLFLISGPTGAGKTTILDAICLALYHRTPRLKSLSKESNELMTRHTGLCFSEITFSTGKKKYRARWEQHRAGKKPTGSLQPPRCELCLAETGEIITTKLADKLKNIESICGLNFERFTRSVLLAQGNFTAFLKADKKKKAELLEEITGTEIYGKISILTFRRMRAEEEKLKLLKLDLSGLHLLEEKELNELLSQKAILQNSLKSLNKNQDKLTKKIAWLKLLNETSKKINTAKDELKKSEQSYEKHKDDFTKLKLALPAQKIHQQLITLKQLKEDYQNTENLLTELKRQKKDADAKHQDLSSKLKIDEEKLKTFSSIKESSDKLIHHEIMPLDNEISSLQDLIKEPTAALEENCKNQQTTSTQISKLTAQQQQLSHYLGELRNWLKAHENLEALGPKLQLLKQQVVQLTQIDDLLAANNKSLETEQQNLSKIEKSFLKNDELLKQHSKHSEQTTNHLKQIKENITLIDPDNSLQETLKAKQEANFTIKGLPDAAQKLRDLSHKIHTRTNKLNSLTQLKAKLDSKLPELQKDLNDKRIILEQSRKILEQERTIQDLQVYRDQLQANSPCLVCGSTEHPAIQEYSQLDLTETKKLSLEAETNFNESQKRHIETCKDTEKISSELLQINTELQNEEKAWKSESEIWKKHCQLLQVKLDFLDEGQIRHFKENCKKELEDLTQKYQKLQDFEDKLKEQEHQLQTVREKVNSAKSEQAILNEKQKQLGFKIAQLKQELSENKSKKDSLRKEVDLELNAFQSEKSYENRLKLAQKAFENYQNSLKNEQNSSSQQQKVDLELSAKKEVLKKFKLEQTTISQKVSQLQNKIENLKKQRKQKFGDKSTAAELQLLATQLKQQLSAFEQAKSTLIKQSENLAKLTAQQHENGKNSKQLISRVQTAEKDYNKSLQESPFQNELELISTLLPHDKLEQLTNLQKQLSEELTINKTRLNDLEVIYKKELAKALTEESLEKLEKSVLEKSKEIQTLTEDINKIELKLREQQQLQNTQANKLKIIEQQQETFNLWATLSSLIGSADGQAFRNYAQGLTLDHLVSLANIHLERLHDRYFLTRQDDDSLNLNIIDCYQADAVRPVETLSGGESFLVSLSLALALSDLASDRVSIESLFLDEGFGTLDPETLETALTALDHLQASGRMIGVISHVQLLKERIPSKIQLYVNEGMGISRLDDKYEVINN